MTEETYNLLMFASKVKTFCDYLTEAMEKLENNDVEGFLTKADYGCKLFDRHEILKIWSIYFDKLHPKDPLLKKIEDWWSDFYKRIENEV